MGLDPQPTEARFFAHPLVRLQPAEAGSWLLARSDRRRGHQVSSKVAAVVVRCFEPATLNEIALLAGLEDPAPELLAVVQSLIEFEYLYTKSDEAERAAETLLLWSQFNWRASAQYFVQTKGYQFERYEPDGTSAEDLARMRAYNEVETDTDRSKAPPVDPAHSYRLPDISSSLADQDAVTALTGSPFSGVVDKAAILSLLTLVTRPVALAWTPFPTAAPVIRKTSPSGGSRHPTELYAFTDGIDGIADSWYHVAGVEGQMSSLPLPKSASECLELAKVPQPAGPWVLLVFTSVFRRNRYRYREPRTFRTVHMDVGHIMTTTEFIANAFGMRVDHATQINSAALGTLLQIDPLVESPISASLICGGRSK